MLYSECTNISVLRFSIDVNPSFLSSFSLTHTHRIFIMADISRCRLPLQNPGSYPEMSLFWMLMDWRTAFREGL